MAAVRETLERELKLAVDEGFRLDALPGTPLEPRDFTSTYVDTEDLRLARAGVTLRRRVERGRGLWQLKLPRDGARLELELPGGAAGPPADLADLLTAYARGAPLRPVATLRTRRAGVRVARGEQAVADVALDSVSVLADGRIAAAFRELEAELVGGDEGELEWVEQTLRAAGATDGDARPKVFRALGLDAPPGSPRPPARSAPPAEHLRAALSAQVRALAAHDPGTRLGADAEELHQLRVATRRLRAFLRAARPLLERDWAESLRAELAWLGAALGPVRDLDVLVEQLEADAATLDPGDRRALAPLFELLQGEREEARAPMLAALRSDRYLALLERLETASAEPRLAAGEHPGLRELAAAEFRRLRTAVRALEADPDDAALHDARIRGKRARYAAELAERSVGKAAGRFVREAKAFQDVLGAHQDAVVAEEAIRRLLPRLGEPDAAFAAGRLVERQRARRAQARAAFPSAWARLERQGRAAWS